MTLLKAAGGEQEGASWEEGELAETLWAEMGLQPDAHITHVRAAKPAISQAVVQYPRPIWHISLLAVLRSIIMSADLYASSACDYLPVLSFAYEAVCWLLNARWLCPIMLKPKSIHLNDLLNWCLLRLKAYKQAGLCMVREPNPY